MADPKVGVAVILIDGKKVLLGERRGSHGDGTWCFPGGNLEFGESPLLCAKRELKEETGLNVTQLMQGPYTNDVFERENKHYVTLFVLGKYEGGTPDLREPEKCKGWRWFEWGQLPAPLFLPIQNLLKQGFTLPGNQPAPVRR